MTKVQRVAGYEFNGEVYETRQEAEQAAARFTIGELIGNPGPDADYVGLMIDNAEVLSKALSTLARRSRPKAERPERPKMTPEERAVRKQERAERKAAREAGKQQQAA